MRPVKGLGLLAALTIALGLVLVQPAVAPAATKVEAATSAQVAIANLAYANLGISACQTTSLGGYITAPDSTPACNYSGSWCGIFAGWVWNKSGRVNTTDSQGRPLGHGPQSFYTYGFDSNTLREADGKNMPAKGDAVIFSSSSSTSSPGAWSHVGIVYSVDPTTHMVVTVAGNEISKAGGNGYVGLRIFYYNTRRTLSTPTSPVAYWAFEYVTPRFK